MFFMTFIHLVQPGKGDPGHKLTTICGVVELHFDKSPKNAAPFFLETDGRALSLTPQRQLVLYPTMGAGTPSGLPQDSLRRCLAEISFRSVLEKRGPEYLQCRWRLPARRQPQLP